MSNKDLEIRMSVLKVIYNAMIPMYHRLNSLLEDMVYKNILLSETDRAVLLEYCSCAGALKTIFESYFDSYPDLQDEEKIVLPYQEYVNIMSLAKTVELATRTTLGGLTLQEH